MIFSQGVCVGGVVQTLGVTNIKEPQEVQSSSLPEEDQCGQSEKKRGGEVVGGKKRGREACDNFFCVYNASWLLPPHLPLSPLNPH